MARAKKTKEVIDLNPRNVKFNVKATPRVREARRVLLNAIVGSKGREADLEALVDTLEVLSAYLDARGRRDMANRVSLARQEVKTATARQAELDKQREVTAEHYVTQAEKGLAEAQAQLEAVKAK